jgi:hypothetical protein
MKRAAGRIFIMLLLVTCCALSALAQTTVSGVVNDIKGNGIEGVTVSEKGGKATTLTDNNGHFSITVADSKGALLFTHTTFQAEEVPLQGKTTIVVVLAENTTKLNEVVVVGYGKQSRDKVTTSISKLDQRTLENIPYANALSALQGSISGVRVQTYNGQPGLGPRIIVRGGTTINNPNGAAPLYIIDGVIRTNMDDVAPADIESLKKA